GVMHSIFNGSGPWCGTIMSRANGAMVSDREGVATPYAIFHLQERGRFFVSPGQPVYEGMIVGEYSREINLPVNVCREKKLTNMRAAGHDEAVRGSPARATAPDLALGAIGEGGLGEVKPHAGRMRSRVLKTELRNKHRAGFAESSEVEMAEGDS